MRSGNGITMAWKKVVQKDIHRGVAKGYRRLVNSIIKKIQKNKSLEQIADELEEAVEDIQPIYDIVKKYAPEYDVDAITAEVLEVRENKEK